MTAPGVAVHYYALHGVYPSQAAGLVQVRRPREAPETLVGVYNAVKAGIEEAGWATVCEVHSRLVIHETRVLALRHASNPTGWCQVCDGTEEDNR